MATYEAYFATLVEELSSRGIDTAALNLNVPAEISSTWLAAQLARALQLTNDPGLAIAYGLRLNLASHGILGYALMSSRNGDQLLSLLTRYAVLVMPNLRLTRVVAGKRLLLVCETSEGLLPQEFVTELVLTTLVSGARALFNRRIPGAELWLDFPEPPQANRYAALKLPVRFDQPHSALICDRAFLDMQISSANPVMAEIGARQCDDLLNQMQSRTGISQQIRRSLLRAHGKFSTQEEMAEHLNVSARTLRRRLGEEGTNYRQIVDEVRFELAKRYLQTSELSVSQIAELLAYEDPANFRRAFKRWSGASTQDWRRIVTSSAT